MEVLDPNVITYAGTFGFAGKDFRHVVDALPLPVGNHVGVHAIAAPQLKNGALDRLQGYLGLELDRITFTFGSAHGCFSFVSWWLSTLLHCPNFGDHL